jgi:phage gp36-like protein
MAYCSQTDLEFAVGGAATLVQLLDKDGDGYADAGFVSRILSRATGEAKSAVQVACDLTSLENGPLPDSLVYAVANIAAYYAFLEGTQGQGVPDSIRSNYEDALRWLDQVARRERSLGATPRATTDQSVGQVDPDPYGCKVSRRSLRGLW